MSEHDPHDDSSRPRLYIGPETEHDASRLIEEARERVRDEDEQNKESNRLAKRLFFALVLIIAMSIIFYVVMPYYGLRLPPFVPILCFAAIAAGAILTLRDLPTES